MQFALQHHGEADGKTGCKTGEPERPPSALQLAFAFGADCFVNERRVRPALLIDFALLLARQVVEFSRWSKTFTRLGHLRPVLFLWRALFHHISREGRRCK